jgi:hypothetical protein
MESDTKCIRCGTDTATDLVLLTEEGRVCGLCEYDETGKGAVVTCVECHERRHLYFLPELQERLVRDSCCYNCDFWRQRVAMKDDPNVVRVDGEHYLIGEPFLWFKGFDGRRFVIDFLDGRRVESDCLWIQGTIPPHFRERLPDNARFI